MVIVVDYGCAKCKGIGGSDEIVRYVLFSVMYVQDASKAAHFFAKFVGFVKKSFLLIFTIKKLFKYTEKTYEILIFI